MAWKIEHIVEQISEKNPLHAKKLKKALKKVEEEYFERSEAFLTKYENLLTSENKTLDYGVDCYLQMIADFNFETVKFMETGVYSSTSFAEVNERVYSKPEVMEYYMHGLLLSQFLFMHHYAVLKYFEECISTYAIGAKSYLEVGGGHGLYISEAIDIIGQDTEYDLVDISASSIALAKKMISHQNVNYFHEDIFAYEPGKKYDFITMGEVLEHVEDPIALLQRLGELLNPGGRLFITTPTNAPAIDHIYLFRDKQEIVDLIAKAGFQIEADFSMYAEDVPEEVAEQFKISLLFAGVLKK